MDSRSVALPVFFIRLRHDTLSRFGGTAGSFIGGEWAPVPHTFPPHGYFFVTV
jgi:hypothetical protein